MPDTVVAAEIRRVAREKNALILAHNYQRPEVQDVADLTGDSLALSIEASRTGADIVVFCGVRFMAETAAVICPAKRILLPVDVAGCAMADMLSAEDLRAMKSRLPGVPVITYVNSTAEVKAESDVCCTSANAVEVARAVGAPEILMTPDRNLAHWVQRHTWQKVHSWSGYCPIHNDLTVEAVKKAMADHPGAVLIAHPECPPEVLELTDCVRSTTGMLAYVAKSDAVEFIVATEVGLLYPLTKQNPGKRFFPASPDMVCRDMKRTRLGDVLQALEREESVITVPEPVRTRARKAVERMMAIPRDTKG